MAAVKAGSHTHQHLQLLSVSAEFPTENPFAKYRNTLKSLAIRAKMRYNGCTC